MKVSLSLVLNAVALAMGVASVVILILDTGALENTAMLLALGLCCVALDAVQRTRVVQLPPTKTSTQASRRKK